MSPHFDTAPEPATAHHEPAAGKSTTWPGGEPASVRTAYDALADRCRACPPDVRPAPRARLLNWPTAWALAGIGWMFGGRRR